MKDIKHLDHNDGKALRCFAADDGGRTPLVDADARKDVNVLESFLFLPMLLATLLLATMPGKLERRDRWNNQLRAESSRGYRRGARCIDRSKYSTHSVDKVCDTTFESVDQWSFRSLLLYARVRSAMSRNMRANMYCASHLLQVRPFMKHMERSQGGKCLWRY